MIVTVESGDTNNVRLLEISFPIRYIIDVMCQEAQAKVLEQRIYQRMMILMATNSPIRASSRHSNHL